MKVKNAREKAIEEITKILSNLPAEISENGPQEIARILEMAGNLVVPKNLRIRVEISLWL